MNDGSELEALPCGHVFHCSCMADFLRVTGKRKEEACPHKCHQSSGLLGPLGLWDEAIFVGRRDEAPVVEQVSDTEGEEAINRIV